MPNKITTRPSELTLMHNYNLRNQGWPLEFTSTDRDDGKRVQEVDPVPFTKEVINVYPSNADIVYAAKLTTANRFIGVGSYSPFELRKGVFGNTPAGKGHYILPAFDRNRSLISGIQGLYDPTKDKDRFRPVSVEFFAGRVFYLMPDGKVLYSQVITDRDIRRAERCFQEADPTAEDINELVATDGGTITIQEVGEAVALASTGAELILFADNGVWSISGSDQSNFRATDFRTRRVTNIGASGQDTIVVAEGNVVYWGRGGIYILAQDEISGELNAQNLTEQTIQQFYNDILPAARRHAKGFYDERERKVLWMYNDDLAYDGQVFKNRYNRILFFDTLLGAFYTYTVDLADSLPYMTSVFEREALGTNLVDKDIIVTLPYPPGDFVTTWNTQNTGDSANNQIELPLGGTGLTIHWGDGEVTSGDTGAGGISTTHTYATPGIYTVRIAGNITFFRFGPSFPQKDRLKILQVNQWGSVVWAGNHDNWFLGCANLTFVALDVPNTIGVTSLEDAFRECTSLSLFPSMNLSNVTNFSGTWQLCTSLTSLPSDLNFSSGVTFTSAWRNSGLVSFASYTFTSATDFNTAWRGCTNLITVSNQPSTGSATGWVGSFRDCSSLTNIGTLNMSSAATTGGHTSGVPFTDVTFADTGNISSVILSGIGITVSVRNNNLSAGAIEAIYGQLATVVSSTWINVSGNPGAGTADHTIATTKGWTVLS